MNDTSSGQGKRNELMLLLDYNDDLSLHVMPTGESNGKLSKEKMNFDRAIDRIQSESAKIHINALSPYVGFGGGSYQITDVKRMTATEDFLNMPLKDRNCEVELYENCRTRKLLEECNCVPWEVPGFKVKHQRRDHYLFLLFPGRGYLQRERERLHREKLGQDLQLQHNMYGNLC